MAGNRRKHRPKPNDGAELQHCGPVATPHGQLEYLKIRRHDSKPMGWREVYDRLRLSYPNRWSIMFFPPERRCIDQANIYHVYLMPEDYHPGDADISLRL